MNKEDKSIKEQRTRDRVCENCSGRGSVIIDATNTHATQGFRQMECPVCLGDGVIWRRV